MIRHIASTLAFLLLLSAPLTSAFASAKSKVEVVFVLDTTGSMGGLIEGAKRKIWSIANAIVDCNPNAEIRIGLVAFRDITDAYVTKTFDLTTDLQDLYGNLVALRAQGGGDRPESVNEALYTAVTKISWTPGDDTKRIMFLVGDSPPHMDYQQDTKYPDVLAMARARGIVVNAVQAGNAPDTARIWQDIAQLGQGEFIAIPQDGGEVVVIETPFDEEILDLQRKMNGTVLPYGSHELKRKTMLKMDLATRAPAPVASDMAAFMSRIKPPASHPGKVASALTGEGDLVADVSNGKQKLADLKKDELPEQLAKLEPVAREKYIAGLALQRKEYAAKMAEVVKKRDAYVVAHRNDKPKKTDSFDVAVENLIKKQVGK